MRITLIDAGKRFNRDWIFRHLSYEFIEGQTYAITGPNGSGKSTLLQALGGAIAISEGKIQFPVEEDKFYRYISLAAPYLELIEEMTVLEFLQFHQSFKPFLSGLSIKDITARVGLEKASHKQIRFYSSGMKQRVKLAQAIFSDTPVILLDEPCTNLDTDGIALYRSLIKEFAVGRMVIVSSNDLQEYDFCQEVLNILEYK
ncbi:ABC transporter ATP-binding protein [Flavitalea flava]